MTKQLTFSRQIKDELSVISCGQPCCQVAEIAAAWFAAGRDQGGSLVLTTAHPGWMVRLSDLIRRRYRIETIWETRSDLMSLVAAGSLRDAIGRDINRLFGEETAPGSGAARAGAGVDTALSGECAGVLAEAGECCRRAVLRALFLACGSISEPSQGYHLELSMRNPQAAAMTGGLLTSFGIQAGQLRRHGYTVAYIHEGQHLADFLLITGAHRSLLTFESLRVEKEMRNKVNRVVNCDSANTQRTANTSARQLSLISDFRDCAGLESLPPDLLAAASARLEHPDLSLQELGGILNPSLGKSGMHHRLQRLEKVMAEILAQKGGPVA